MTTPLFQVDAFTDRAFAGNPAAVCLLDGPADEPFMQAVAAEMNLSETAFVSPGDAEGALRLRWFTPAAEVALCGHATLATAHVLWETGRLRPEEPARFATRSGPLSARRAGEAIELDFPAMAPAEVPAPAGLFAALGLTPVAVLRSRDDVLAVLPDEASVRDLRPDLRALRGVDVRGVIVTAAAESESADFVSRFFAPAVGVDEDPVTGAAHCVLAPYWSGRLGRTRLVGRQLSRRGGEVGVELDGDRVRLRGRAVTVLRGELLPRPTVV